jgi:hypothetical protein
MPSIAINIFYVRINSIENGSAFNVGQSMLSDWYNSDKKNQGFGQSYGDETDFFSPQSFIDDRDQIDAPSQKNTLAKDSPKPLAKEVPPDVCTYGS